MNMQEIVRRLKASPKFTYVRHNPKFGWVRFTVTRHTPGGGVHRERYELYENNGLYVLVNLTYDGEPAGKGWHDAQIRVQDFTMNWLSELIHRDQHG